MESIIQGTESNSFDRRKKHTVCVELADGTGMKTLERNRFRLASFRDRIILAKRSAKIDEETQIGRGITGSSNLKFYGRSSVVRRDSEESVPFVGPVADYR